MAHVCATRAPEHAVRLLTHTHTPMMPSVIQQMRHAKLVGLTVTSAHTLVWTPFIYPPELMLKGEFGNITRFTFSPLFLRNKVSFRTADNLSSVSFHRAQKNEGLETQGSVGQRGSQNLKSTNSSWSSASGPWGNKLITVSPY